VQLFSLTIFACALSTAAVAADSFFAQACAALVRHAFPCFSFVCTHVNAALAHVSSALNFPVMTFALTCAMIF
jgi:6,7-dimethyl-8-ribityllumazine synthase